jgi:hypothetical protein
VPWSGHNCFLFFVAPAGFRVVADGAPGHQNRLPEHGGQRRHEDRAGQKGVQQDPEPDDDPGARRG